MMAVGNIDKGKRKECNEDKLFISNNFVGPLPNLYIIADGVGGHRNGEIASELAVNSFYAYMEAHKEVQFYENKDISNLLRRAVAHANYIVYREANKHIKYEGMATTLTVATVIGDNMYIAHVGDSRIYFMNYNKILQITKDHSYVQEMLEKGDCSIDELKYHPLRHAITRAIGTYEKVKVDSLICSLQHVEFILMCSDGLTTMLDDNEIHKIVYKNNLDIVQISQNLIESANAKGGFDNIAVIIAKSEVIV